MEAPSLSYAPPRLYLGEQAAGSPVAGPWNRIGEGCEVRLIDSASVVLEALPFLLEVELSDT